MPDLPARFAAIIVAFAPLFRHRTWLHAEILLVGAILAPGKRTVTSILASPISAASATSSTITASSIARDGAAAAPLTGSLAC
jgi:hypothetical protein